MEFLPEIVIAVVGLIAAAVGVRTWKRKESARKFYALILQLQNRAWDMLRNGSLPAAEQAAAEMLHAAGDGSHLPPYLYGSILYTHGCLLVEEDSVKFAVERFSAASQIAKSRYGAHSVYAAPPAVGLAWLHFRGGNFEKSAKLLSYALHVYQDEFGYEHPRTIRVRAMLALVAFAVGLTKESQRELQAAASAMQAHAGNATYATSWKAIDDALGTVSYFAKRH